MAIDRVPDPAVSINPNLPHLPSQFEMKRFAYRDQLIESLDKATAMMFIFSSSNLEDFSETMLQNFSSATLDMICLAVDALKALNEMDGNK